MATPPDDSYDDVINFFSDEEIDVSQQEDVPYFFKSFDEEEDVPYFLRSSKAETVSETPVALPLESVEPEIDNATRLAEERIRTTG